MNNSIAFFLLIVLFVVGYWLVSWVFTKFKMPKFEYDDSSSASDRNSESKEHSQEQSKTNNDYRRNEDSRKDNNSNSQENSYSYYCGLLNLNGDMSIENIKQQYRELLRKYHPDKVNHLGHEFQAIAEQKTRDINRAYEYFKRTCNFS